VLFAERRSRAAPPLSSPRVAFAGSLVQDSRTLPDQLPSADFSLVDSLVVPASLHDVDGRFVHMNAAAERAIGRTNAELVGSHFTDPVPPEARESVEAQFRQAVESGEATEFETVFVDASGHRRSVRAQHLPLRSDDAIVGVLILAFGARGLPPENVGSRTALHPELTPRQREILDLIASGHSTSEIATALTLSTETVRNHLRNVLRDLNAHTRVEAIATAQRLGLLAPPMLGPPSD
jgi:PAS domain S-box-containing protein